MRPKKKGQYAHGEARRNVPTGFSCSLFATGVVLRIVPMICVHPVFDIVSGFFGRYTAIAAVCHLRVSRRRSEYVFIRELVQLAY